MEPPTTLKLVLQPMDDGSFTQLSFTGALPGEPSSLGLRRLLRTLSGWSGEPTEVVLSVDGNSPVWSDAWIDALAAVPAHLLTVRFRVINEASVD